MKSVLSLVAIAFFAFNVNAQEIKFEKETIDYGTIVKGSDGNRVFKFTNTGDAPLKITRTTASCGCTTPKKPTEAIQPGQTGEITVHYDTNRLGNFSKTITVYSNAKTNATKRVMIKGYITNEVKKEEAKK